MIPHCPVNVTRSLTLRSGHQEFVPMRRLSRPLDNLKKKVGTSQIKSYRLYSGPLDIKSEEKRKRTCPFALLLRFKIYCFLSDVATTISSQKDDHTGVLIKGSKKMTRLN